MGDPRGTGDEHPALSDARHWLGFLIGGGAGFLTDAAVLWILTQAGLSPFIARLGAIMQAMVVAWLVHRTLTFRITAPATLREFLRYAAVAWTSAAVNYGVFAAILLIWPEVPPLQALVPSSLVAMAFAYAGMRFAAFRR